MWSVRKLQELAEQRRETIPKDPLVEQALLAQERCMGRAEKSYDRARARHEMNRLLDRIDDFPRGTAGEFAGLKQLRAYAEERAVQLAEQRRLEKEEHERTQTSPEVSHTSEAEEELEDDMGM